jgi:hypothetical protein
MIMHLFMHLIEIFLWFYLFNVSDVIHKKNDVREQQKLMTTGLYFSRILIDSPQN